MNQLKAGLHAVLCAGLGLSALHCAGTRSGRGTQESEGGASGMWHAAAPQRVTDSSSDQMAPSFSADGARLIYQSNGDGNWELYTLNLADGRPNRLTNTPEAEEDPSWSPDGRWVVCTVHEPSLDADPPRDILLLSADGRTRQKLAAHGADDWSPRFSADGRSVFFVSDRVDERRDLEDSDRKSAIFQLTLSDESLRQLTEAGRFSAPCPIGSDSSGTIILRQDDHTFAGLDLNGQLRPLITDNTLVLGQPDWHAAAGWALTSLSQDADSRLLLRAPGASAWTEVALAGREADMSPAWSPDGKKLVITSRTAGQWDLFLMTRQP